MESSPLYAAFGHHKCATMWAHSIFIRAALDLGLRYDEVFLPREFDGQLGQFVEQRRTEMLLLGNAHFDHVRQLDLSRVRGFHYVRDPRDIVVSAYFSHRNSHTTDAWPELIPYREKLQKVSKEEGLFLELEFRAEQFEEMRSWKDLPEGVRIRHARMEELTADPYRRILDEFEAMGLIDADYYTPGKRIAFVASKSVRRVEHLLGVRLGFRAKRLPAERLLGILWENEFKRISGGRKRGQENAASHFRKGVQGDWINHLNAEHLRFFKERYNDVLLQYGYETEPDWERNYLERIEQRQESSVRG
ncbi:MAG: hypothetical protein GC160_25600 [Acidobacteria bacterium]|nr:hypothetical protein [Acidobacteriota bacterium]